jgi:hypothetical protein
MHAEGIWWQNDRAEAAKGLTFQPLRIKTLFATQVPLSINISFMNLSA